MHDRKQKIGFSSSPAILARFGTRRQEQVTVEAQPTAIQRLKKELPEKIQPKEFQKLAQLTTLIPEENPFTMMRR